MTFGMKLALEILSTALNAPQHTLQLLKIPTPATTVSTLSPSSGLVGQKWKHPPNARKRSLTETITDTLKVDFYL